MRGDEVGAALAIDKDGAGQKLAIAWTTTVPPALGPGDLAVGCAVGGPDEVGEPVLHLGDRAADPRRSVGGDHGIFDSGVKAMGDAGRGIADVNAGARAEPQTTCLVNRDGDDGGIAQVTDRWDQRDREQAPSAEVAGRHTGPGVET